MPPVDLSGMSPEELKALRDQADAALAAAPQPGADPLPAAAAAEEAALKADAPAVSGAIEEKAEPTGVLQEAGAEALKLLGEAHAELDKLFGQVQWPPGPQFAAVKAWGEKVNGFVKIFADMAKALEAEI